MKSLCLATGGITGEELMRESLGIFGFRRMTPRITARMQEALAFSIGAGLVRAEGDYFRDA